MPSISDIPHGLQRQFATIIPTCTGVLSTQYLKLSLFKSQPADVQDLPHQHHSLIGNAGFVGMQSVSDVARPDSLSLVAIFQRKLPRIVAIRKQFSRPGESA